MRITSAGMVGIGTTNPNRMLTVEGDGGEPDISLVNLDNTNNNFNQIRFLSVGSDDSTRRLGADIKALYTSHSTESPTTDLVFGTASGTSASTERMRITSTGNVGIGISSPASKLEIYSTATYNARTSGINIHRPGSYGQYASISYNAGSTYYSSTYTGAGAGSYGDFRWQAYDSTSTPVERMRINSSGNVLIGNTNNETKANLEVNNSIALQSDAFYSIELGKGHTGSVSTITLTFDANYYAAQTIIEVQMFGYNSKYLDHIVGSYAGGSGVVVRNNASGATVTFSSTATGVVAGGGVGGS